MKMVYGLLRPDSGTARIAGHDAGTLSAKTLVGYVPQNIALYPDLTARENLRFLGRLFGLGGRLIDERVDEALELTDLGDRAGERIDSYSGGMQRRLNIAAGPLNHPSLLVLDEPTGGGRPPEQARHSRARPRLWEEGDGRRLRHPLHGGGGAGLRPGGDHRPGAPGGRGDPA